MSLVQNIAMYIEENSAFVMDETLFVGADTVDTPPGSIIVREFMGSSENESGLEERSIQILALDRWYVNAEALINTVYALFANKPGFVSDSLIHVFYVSVSGMPGFVDRDASGNFVFSCSLLFRIP